VTKAFKRPSMPARNTGKAGIEASFGQSNEEQYG